MFRPSLITSIFQIKPQFSSNIIKPKIHNNFIINSLFNRSLKLQNKIIKKEENSNKLLKQINKDIEKDRE